MLNIQNLLVVFIVTAGVAVGDVPYSGNEDTEVEVKTFTYKQVGDLEIKANVLMSDGEGSCPIVVWIHGGALINGGRQGIDGRVKRMLLEAGYTIVSIDYRLAPETKLPEIIADLEDAFAWIRDRGPELFNARTDRIAVMGGSAGGYLTLTSGFRVKPRPTVLVSFYGYGDLIGDWYSKPSPHPRHWRNTMTKVEVAKVLQGPPVANAGDRVGHGGGFYQYCRQKGLWPFMISDFDPLTQPEKFDPFMPVRNVTSDYPPTMLIHGTNDTDVPYQQSELMVEQFKKHGVPFELQRLVGGEHGLGGASPQDINQAYEAALRFVNKHMQQP